MKIQNKGNGKAEIYIYEDIGEGWLGGLSAKAFADEVKGLGKLTQINVRINSAGGSVFDGIAIYNTLVKNPARVIVDIDGLAASIASVVAMAGDEINIADNAMMMIHDPWTVASGSAGELRKTADLLDLLREQLLDTYDKRSSASRDDISLMMDDETWFTSQQALDFGLVDKVTDEVKMAAYDLSKFKHPPRILSEQTPTNRGDLAREKVARMGARVGARKQSASARKAN